MAKKLAVVGAVLLLLHVVAAAAWAASRSTTHSTAARTAFSTRQAGGAVTGTLNWRILRSYTSRQIKNAYVPVTAKGIYVIMNVAATNSTSRSVALDSDGIRLELNGVKYPLAPAGVQGLGLAGHKALAGPSLGPSGTTSGWLAFDVPLQAASSVPQLCLDGATCLPVPQV